MPSWRPLRKTALPPYLNASSRRGVLAIAVLAGLSATAVLQYWFGPIDGSFWLTAAGVAAGIAAISLTVLGLESFLGYAGLGLAVALLMFVASPDGFATGPQR